MGAAKFGEETPEVEQTQPDLDSIHVAGMARHALMPVNSRHHIGCAHRSSRLLVGLVIIRVESRDRSPAAHATHCML